MVGIQGLHTSYLPKPITCKSISGRSIRSRLTKKSRFHPLTHKNRCTASSIKTKKRNLTDAEFFNGLTTKRELGLDFLREMNCPIDISRPLLLPVSLNDLAPGRCLTLSPFGHASNLCFHCEICSQKNSTNSTGHDTGLEIPTQQQNELSSVALTFFHQSDKIISHKVFYGSLLSNSPEFVTKSFSQPGLLYTYTIIKQLCPGPEPIPVFQQTLDELLIMHLIFKVRDLHLNESCLRLLTDNLPNYHITVDCVQKQYLLRLTPLHPEEKTVTVAEQQISDSIMGLDISDELKDEIHRASKIVLKC